MANYIKWLGVGLGWAMGGPIGAALGYAMGSLFGKDSEVENNPYGQRTGNPYNQTNDRAYNRSNTKPGDFEVALLILAAKVITSDGKTDQRELDFVRANFVKMYGQHRANNAFRLFKEIIKNESISTREVCIQITQYMDHASRLQLVHFLFGIANSDGHVHSSEVSMIQTIANYLNISKADFESIMNMFKVSTVDYYKILEVDKNASDDEIKKAYRKMARKYHPDRVQHLGEEHLAGAKDKFQKVQEAYEKIKKERGI
jgi:DnaJ like chaperone protein